MPRIGSIRLSAADRLGRSKAEKCCQAGQHNNEVDQGSVGNPVGAVAPSRIGSDKTSDIYNASRTFLYFGSAYAFREHWAVYFNAKNLVNTPHTFYEGTPDRPTQREFYRQTFQLGVRFNY
jgi:hypothetical protein